MLTPDTCTAHSHCIRTYDTCTAQSHCIRIPDTCTVHSHCILTPHNSQSLYYTYTWPAGWPSCVGHCLPPHSCTAQSHCSGQAWCCELMLIIVCMQSPLSGKAYRRPSGCESFFGDCPPATRSELGHQAPCSRPLQGECPRWQGRILWLWWGLH